MVNVCKGKLKDFPEYAGVCQYN